MKRDKYFLLHNLLFTVIILLTVLTVIGYFSLDNKRIVAYEQTADFGLVFAADDFQRKDDYLRYQQMLVNGSPPALFTVQPFQQLREELEIYRVFESGSLCNPHRGCDYPKLERKVREMSEQQLPQHLRLIVISQQKFRPYALYTTDNNSALFLSLRNRYGLKRNHTLQRELLHELGHLFGLKEERGRTNFSLNSRQGQAISSPLNLPGKPNCARNLSQAKGWWGDWASNYADVGYFRGCAGNANWIKPHKDSLMRSPYQNVNSYGRVNQRFLRHSLCSYLEKEIDVCSNFSSG